MRSIIIGVPSGTIKMILWQGTEDEEAFKIHALDSKHPYVKAYGIKYPLSDKEIKEARALKGIILKSNKLAMEGGN